MYPEKQTSQKQIDANRLNAKKSTGPTTDEGKAKVALNALRHGITSQVTLMTPEDRDAHERHMNEYLAMYKPDNFVERDLAMAIAGDAWRLKVSRAHEQNIYAVGHTRNAGIGDQTAPGPEPQHPQIVAALSAAQTYLDDCREIQLLTLYEQRIQRAMQKNIAALRTLQAERVALRAAALRAATVFAQFCHAQGKPYNAAEDPSRLTHNFVFTSAEINLHLRLERTNDKMRHHHATGWKLDDGYAPNHPPIIEAPEDAFPGAVPPTVVQ